MVHIHRGATAGIQHAGGGTRTSPIDVTLAGIVTDVREVNAKALCTRSRGEHAQTHPADHTSDDDSKFERNISLGARRRHVLREAARACARRGNAAQQHAGYGGGATAGIQQAGGGTRTHLLHGTYT